MDSRNLSEQERRELANDHRGEVVTESGRPVQPRQLDQVVSLRLDPNTISALRDIATRRGMTVSDVLREGASMVIVAAGEVRSIMDLSYEVHRVDAHMPTGGASAYTANPVKVDQAASATA